MTKEMLKEKLSKVQENLTKAQESFVQLERLFNQLKGQEALLINLIQEIEKK